MHKDSTRRRHLGVAWAAVAAAALMAPSAVAKDGGADEKHAPSPPSHAPAHGVRGTSPEAPPAHANNDKPRSDAAAQSAGKPAGGARSKKDSRRGGKSRGAGRPDDRAAQSRGGERRSDRSRGAKPGDGAGSRAAKSRGGERRSDRSRGAKPGDGRGPKGGDAPGSPKSDDASRSSNGGGQPKVTICHSTGSETNPFVEITIAEPAVKAHQRHHDGADIVPAPAGGCPKPATAAVQAAADGLRSALGVVGAAPQAPAPPAPPAAPAAPAAPVAVTAASRSATPDETVGVGSSMIATEAPAGDVTTLAASDRDEQGVLGESATIDDRPTEAAPRTTVAADDGTGLPFTGMQALLVALVGAGMLLAGFALHRASRQPV